MKELSIQEVLFGLRKSWSVFLFYLISRDNYFDGFENKTNFWSSVGCKRKRSLQVRSGNCLSRSWFFGRSRYRSGSSEIFEVCESLMT